MRKFIIRDIEKFTNDDSLYFGNDFNDDKAGREEISDAMYDHLEVYEDGSVYGIRNCTSYDIFYKFFDASYQFEELKNKFE